MATDTVYGLHCSALSEDAVSRLRALKGSGSRPFILLVSEPAGIRDVAVELSDSAMRLAEAFWPGPLTLILKASPATPEWLQGPGETVAVRCPGRSLCLPVLRRMEGPLVSTSANSKGGAPCLTGSEAAAAFLDRVDLVVDSGVAPSQAPSTIVDVTVRPHRVIRQGGLRVSADLLSGKL